MLHCITIFSFGFFDECKIYDQELTYSVEIHIDDPQ